MDIMNNLNEHDKLTQKYFDKWAKNFEKMGFAFQYFQKRVISIMNPKPHSTFLDLGCGTGWAVRYVSSLAGGQGCFIGIDISEKMIEKAKEIAKGVDNIIFYNANSEELPLENNYIDNIICTFSFHHYLHPEKALSEAFRVLKPKGRLYILDGTPDDFFTKWIDNVALKMQKEHVKQYNTIEFKQLFDNAGLKYLAGKTILLYPIKLHIAEK
jgi:ubiquinone/menaquinone biosynthesis C-methylase UbiE